MNKITKSIIASIVLIGSVLIGATAAPADVSANAHVVGVVVDAATQASLSGIDVTISPQPSGTPINVTTDSGGFYNASAVPAGSYLIRFTDPSGNHVTEYNVDSPVSSTAMAVTVTDNHTTVADADLTPAAVLSGTVVDVNGPVVGATVRILKAPTYGAYKSYTTDVNGNWSSTAIPVQDYKIRYEATGHFAQYNDNVPTTGTSGLAGATVISPTQGANAVPTANMVLR